MILFMMPQMDIVLLMMTQMHIVLLMMTTNAYGFTHDDTSAYVLLMMTLVHMFYS
jgi:hypothetical protein